MIPQNFIESLAGLPGLDTSAFLAAMEREPAVSIKINKRKFKSFEEIGYGALTPVKWCESGFYLPERPKFTLNPLLHAGVFYVQDASSMIHETIVGSLRKRGLLPDGLLALDLCAAPGGKTTSIINALDDTSFIVANEVVPQRARILRENLVKWGFPSVMVASSPTSVFATLGETFDLVAVDAPCSGEGMMRKEEEARAQWGPGLVKQCASLQREILSDAADALKPGGILIYSTCTFNRCEDEENVAWLVEELGLEPVDMEFPEEWGIGEAIESQYPALRFMPHLTRGEGLFAAVLRKPGHLIPGDRVRMLQKMRKKLRLLLDGVPASTVKGKTELPAPELPLFLVPEVNRFPMADVDKETALRFLRHEAIQLPPEAPRGFTVISYSDHPLGLAKNIGNRANNLYPAEWRIRNL